MEYDDNYFIVIVVSCVHAIWEIPAGQFVSGAARGSGARVFAVPYRSQRRCGELY